MTTGLWTAVAAVVVAVAFGLYRQYADGRFRARTANPTQVEAPKPGEPTDGLWASVTSALPDAERGERATLLQFSSAFCAPCRATRRTLADIAEVVPGVVHVEVDAEYHLELVRELGILRTPTTLILDGTGTEVTRAAGAPRKEQVLAALP
ncbi:thioredoxin family protein [Nocardioides sp. W7]|uniref:thioredoxin family protein n=1 Tax=Nocardioides sp. W7 TaxID=2931390 RepID=UPI001FD17F86|nr:thioredoxin family protein [Nocardioides sp. W7]